MGNTNSTPQTTSARGSAERPVVGEDANGSPLDSQGRSSRLSRRLSYSHNTLFSNSRRSGLNTSLRDSRSSSPRLRSNHERHEGERSPGRGLQTMSETPLEQTEWRSDFDSGILSEVSSPRRSRISRLGSRLLPDSVIRGLLNSGEETAEEGRVLRGLGPEEDATDDRNRFGLSTSDRDSPPGGSESMSGPNLDGQSSSTAVFAPPSPSPENLSINLSPASQISTQPIRATPESTSLQRTATRLRRIRDSFAIPIPRIFGRPDSQSVTDHALRTANDLNGNSPGLLGPAQNDTRIDGEGTVHELDSSEPEARHNLRSAGLNNVRRLPPTLRSRSTRLVRRGEHPPLSQVLQLAATAIAAQLSGQTVGSGGTSRPLNGAAFDGSIQNFVQTLQEAATAQAGADFDMNATDGDLPPVNFMRVFQFPNDENGSPIAAEDPRQIEADDAADRANGDRSVTLVLVGVRSMPHTPTPPSDEPGSNVQSLDTLLNLPFLPSGNLLRNATSGAMFRRSDGRARLNSRRQSLNNYSFPSQYESQRHQRTRPIAAQSSSDPQMATGSQDIAMTTQTPMSESPPGPIPPPSTPAYIESGRVTPVERPASAAAAPRGAHIESGEDSIESSNLDDPDSLPPPTRLRRRSDIEFARRPDLGSGASRRNGVVEPDHVPSGAGRSWLIYVVGTNVSPDHPAFTMPSLFTDNPSYEDMQMLSTLLGPVKPPVATEDDVQSAGGRYRLVLEGENLVGHSVLLNGPAITVHNGDRCLVCLSEYEAGEEIRQLKKCLHVYHQECIDEWLTTGRNSCPMCREKGVEERQQQQ